MIPPAAVIALRALRSIVNEDPAERQLADWQIEANEYLDRLDVLLTRVEPQKQHMELKSETGVQLSIERYNDIIEGERGLWKVLKAHGLLVQALMRIRDMPDLDIDRARQLAREACLDDVKSIAEDIATARVEPQDTDFISNLARWHERLADSRKSFHAAVGSMLQDWKATARVEPARQEGRRLSCRHCEGHGTIRERLNVAGELRSASLFGLRGHRERTRSAPHSADPGADKGLMNHDHCRSPHHHSAPLHYKWGGSNIRCVGYEGSVESWMRRRE